jgi:O-antigen/teichoic acid export membrane protein
MVNKYRKKLKLSQFKINALSGSFVHAMKIIIVMFSIPLYIKLLGFEMYSLWKLMTVVISFAQFGEFGLGRAVITYVSSAKGREDKNEIKSIISNATYFQVLISIIVMALIILLKKPLIGILNVPEEYSVLANNILPWVGLATLTYMFFDLYSSFVTGLGRLDISNMSDLLKAILRLAITVLFIKLGYSLYSFIIGTFVSKIIVFIILYIVVRKQFGICIFALKKFSLPVVKQLLNFGFSMIGTQVLNMLCFPLVKIILSNSIGLHAVGIFELTTKVSYALQSLIRRAFYALLPHLSKLTAQLDNKRLLYEHNIKINKLLFRYCIPIFIVFGLAAPLWLRLWLGVEYRPVILYGYWLLQPGILMGLFATPALYSLMATEDHRYNLYEALIRNPLTLVLFGFFYLKDLPLIYSFLIITIGVVISNAFLLRAFSKKFKPVRV